MISLTENAKREVLRLSDEDDIAASIRVSVKGGGCSGFLYSLIFDDTPAEGDLVYEKGEVTVFTDPKSVLYLTGMEVDFSDGLQGKGFEFRNPAATGTCGCGQSFSA